MQRLARTTALRQLSKRAMSSMRSTQTPATADFASKTAEFKEALRAAVASSDRIRSAAAESSAASSHELSLKQHSFGAQMELVMRENSALQAAAAHLRGIPLKSKHEYKSIIAEFNSARRN
jgi:hypothetical protein